MKNRVSIVRTGVANLASVVAAFERLDCEIAFVEDAAGVQQAQSLVLPGVGAFAAAWEALERQNLVAALQERLQRGAPLLSICLGLQLAARSSSEAQGLQGLGAVPADAVRFPDTVRVPQLGWNRMEPDAGCELLKPGYVVFANSYALPAPPEGQGLGDWKVSRAQYGIEFVAALERGSQLLCQFHPELSGSLGAELLSRWVQSSQAAIETGGATC